MTSRIVLLCFLAVVCCHAQMCPTPTLPYAWSQYTWVPYTFSQGVGGPPPDAFNPLSIAALGIGPDVNLAASAWTTANSSQNSTQIAFYYTSSGGAPYSFLAYTVNYPGSLSDPGVGAQTAKAIVRGTPYLAQATTTFYYGAISPTGGNTIINTQMSNYHTFILKVSLHEIGHTMGLDDEPLIQGLPCGGQVFEESVMNGWCNQNDSSNNMPTAVTSCDNSSAW